MEGVRVGLLGFKRGVEEVRGKVGERKTVVEGLLKEKKRIGREAALGRGLIEVDARLEELEERLMVASLGRTVGSDGEAEGWSESEDEEEGDDDEDVVGEVGAGGTSTVKLQRLVNDYREVDDLAECLGREHPFIVAQQTRFMQIRNTILLDLSTATKLAAAGGQSAEEKVMKLLGIYADLDATEEAVQLFKDLKSR